ncbi:MAG: MOSC N-terminal beta barrel domain-containing protein [Planctomycetia bacterium]|nr:MOSC N-terminal beta barrel domain-containing protein [Planctomycetia bacterium]
MARLAGITVYPIKSLEGLSVDAATVLPTAALEHDRRYAIRDTRGRWVNGKSNAKVHLLRASFDAGVSAVTLRRAEDDVSKTFRLDDQLDPLAEWLSDFFGEHVIVVEDRRAGFPDDSESPGPTLVSRQTLEAVGSWFGGLAVGEVQRRFRPNLVVDADAAFWEDRLVADEQHVMRFRIGEIIFEGVTPCQRCVVPTRHPESGEVIPHFGMEFSVRREASLPAWTLPARFDHFYRLSVNTRLAPTSGGGTIRVADDIEILDTFRA